MDFVPKFILFKSARIFAFDYFKNIIDRIKGFKGSKWEQKIKDNPEMYRFFKKKLDEHLLKWFLFCIELAFYAVGLILRNLHADLMKYWLYWFKQMTQKVFLNKISSYWSEVGRDRSSLPTDPFVAAVPAKNEHPSFVAHFLDS